MDTLAEPQKQAKALAQPRKVESGRGAEFLACVSHVSAEKVECAAMALKHIEWAGQKDLAGVSADRFRTPENLSV
jgi:hypothetical protein